jgi:hypothetical protein
LAVIFAVNAGVFMVAVSCLPDLAKAGLSFDAGDINPDVITVVPAQCGDGVVDLDAGEQCDPPGGDGGAVGCVSCRLTCDDGGLFDERTGHCYFVGGAPTVAYVNAGNQCKEGAGHVVTFADEAEYQRVVAWAKGQAFWVGLEFGAVGWETQNNEPGWSGRCLGCYAHVDAGADVFPLLRDGGGARACVLADGTSDRPWLGAPCTIPAAQRFAPTVICEREPSGLTQHPCNEGTCMGGRSGARYILIKTPVTVQEAYQGCQSFGARPVVFETHEEREELARELIVGLPKSTLQVWVGLSRANGFSQNGSWTWADDAGVNAYPLEWGNAQPSGSGSWAYMSLATAGYDVQLLQVDTGTLKLPYICEF